MALKKDKGEILLAKTIREQIRHKDYLRVCALAKEYTAYVTGENADDLIVSYSPRETKEEKNQRISITQIITQYMAARLMTPMYKAGRTLATRTMTWDQSEKAEENLKRLNDAISHYFGQMSVDDYLAYRMVELDSTDPNTFIVTDFEGEVKSEDPNTHADPYPFEVNSEEAIDFKYKNNILQYLTVLNVVGGLNKYTMYLSDVALIAQQISADAYKALKDKSKVLFKDLDKKEEDEIYILSEVNLKPGRVPAIRVGTKKDLTTRGRTTVPLMHAARPFFKKSIKIISELDLTITLHTFPQKWQYDTMCPGDLANNIICIGGKTPGGGICHSCNGTGWNEHKSAQNIVRVPMPDNIKDVVSLENFSHYKYPPIDMLKFMKDYGMYELVELGMKALYNGDTFTTDTISKTATETNQDFESVYDALKPFTDQWSNVEKHIINVTAAYLSIAKGLTVEHKFPKDFKMKPVTMLMEDLSKANTSGAPAFIKKQLISDIAHKLYVDKPEEILKLGVKEKFYPFNGKTEGEIAMAMTDGLVRRYHKVLFANFETIFDEIEQENTSDVVSFWKMEFSRQKELVAKKVGQYIELLDQESANTRAAGFGAFGEDQLDPNKKEDENEG